jgi:hypothetical protein
MTLSEWSKSSVVYGRKLMGSGLEGVRVGKETFLDGEPFEPFLSESVRRALKPAAIGACLCLLGNRSRRHQSAGRTFAAAFLGGAIGFGAGLVWESRCLTQSIASEALKNIGKVRDEHWLEKHPIDYA